LTRRSTKYFTTESAKIVKSAIVDIIMSDATTGAQVRIIPAALVLSVSQNAGSPATSYDIL
jgi:hypothetical protein